MHGTQYRERTRSHWFPAEAICGSRAGPFSCRVHEEGSGKCDGSRLRAARQRAWSHEPDMDAAELDCLHTSRRYCRSLGIILLSREETGLLHL